MVLADNKGRASLFGNLCNHLLTFLAVSAASGYYVVSNRISRPFANFMIVIVYTAHSSLGSEGNKGKLLVAEISLSDAEFLLCQNYDTPALRRFIRQGGQLGCISQLFF